MSNPIIQLNEEVVKNELKRRSKGFLRKHRRRLSRKSFIVCKSGHTPSKKMPKICSKKFKQQDLRMPSLNIRDNSFQARGA